MFSMFNRLPLDYVYFKVSKTRRQIWSIVRCIVTGRFSVRKIENARYSQYSKDSIDVVSRSSNLPSWLKKSPIKKRNTANKVTG